MGSTLYSKRHKSEQNRNRKKRPKSFSSEESAKKWIEKNEIKDYLLKKPTHSLSNKIWVIVK